MLAAACLVLIIEPANGRIPTMVGGLTAMLAVNLVLMRRTVRRLARSLWPEVLDELGLVPEMTNLCDRLSAHTGLEIKRSLSDVADDGIGSGTTNGTAGGIRGMRERALPIGGRLTVEPAGRTGSRVRLRIPLHEAKAA